MPRDARVFEDTCTCIFKDARTLDFGSTFALPKLPGLFCKRALSVQKNLGDQIAPCEMSGNSREDTLYMSYIVYVSQSIFHYMYTSIYM